LQEVELNLIKSLLIWLFKRLAKYQNQLQAKERNQYL